MPKKGDYVKFKNYERKLTVLVPEDNRKQNPEGSYTNKYQ